jgi:tricorn protease
MHNRHSAAFASPLSLAVALVSCASAAPVSAPQAPAKSALQSSAASAEPDAVMLRYPDVSASEIVFVYADDLWLVPREGGVARPLASPSGLEALPRFSPDGQTIAFVGNYDGNKDLYTIPTRGGIPTRVTHHSATEVLCNWMGADKLLFWTNGFAGRDRIVELFSVSASGGLPQKLPVPYGAFADVSADGRWLAYTPHTTDNRTWKRYRGGMSTDIWLFDLAAHTSKRATEWEGTDTAPMWNGSTLFYLSDDGPSHRLNLWNFDPASGKRRQLTQYADFDVKWPAMGPGPKGGGEIVFQHGPALELYDIPSGTSHAVSVTIPGARPKLRPRAVDVSKFIDSWDLSPSGKRVLADARGDVWSLPAKDGSPRNLTHSSASAERDPCWSPDGKQLAWLSDASGEYEIWLESADGSGEPKRLTTDGKMFRRLLCWSPDSKQLVYSDKTGSMYLQPADGSPARLVMRDVWAGDLISTVPSFSRDSRFLAYSNSDEHSGVPRLWIYEVESGAQHALTAGMFDDALPQFDRKGDYLYFRRRANFQPLYSEIEQSFIYAKTEQIYVVPLRADSKSPFAPKSDEEGEEKKDAKEGDKPADAAAKPDDKSPEKSPEKSSEKSAEKSAGEKAAEKPVEIAFDDFERRAVLMPVEPGVFSQLGVNSEGALLFVRQGVQGSGDDPRLEIFDAGAEKPEAKTLAEGANGFALSGDGKRLLVLGKDGPKIGDAKAEAKFEKLATDGMSADIDPRAEWRQLFDDSWRLMRDFFYDPNMHHVDWKAIGAQYGAMLGDCASREDVSYVIREMISELNVGHAYYNGGDVGDEPHESVGLLGCDFALVDGAYQIARICEGPSWDADSRGPLSQPGVDAHAGDFLLAVNGVALDPARDPWAAFQGLADKVVTLTLSKKPTRDETARSVVVKALASERDLRYRAWIEEHRKLVAAATGGRVGYVYVPSTGIDGQSDLVRQLQGQLKSEALIVDERWNSGGQIPTRFIELLNRPVTNYWARRDGKDWTWPPDGHQGPKCMLINGLSGSGGDAFPFYFRQAGLGKLIGMRTWGGLVGLSGYPKLIDGGDIEVPSFAFYEKDGTWGIEGHGVDPDIEVIDDPALMWQGGDPQLERAIATMKDELAKHPYTPPARPAYPDRHGMGVEAKDK